MKQEIIRIDLDGVNCYLLKENQCFILVDTGGPLVLDKQFINRCEKLDIELEKVGCSSENLKLIVLTHGDNDHVANANYIRNKYKAPIALHLSDLELVENPSLEKVMESFHFKSLIFKIVFFLMKKNIIKITKRMLDEFEVFSPDVFIKEGDQLNKYGVDAKILHIPGHTSGSIGVLTTQNDIIVGDTLTNNKKPSSAPNANDFNKLDLSIKRLTQMNIKKVYPGHGEPFGLKEFKA